MALALGLARAGYGGAPAAGLVRLIPTTWMQVAVLLIAGLLGAALFAPTPLTSHAEAPLFPIGRGAGWAWLAHGRF